MSAACPGCGGRLRYRARFPAAVTIGDVEYRDNVEGWTCAECDREDKDDAAFDAFILSAARACFRRGYRSGAALRFARRVFAWTGQDLAQALGVAPETLSRWENGHLDVPPHVFALVGCLLEDRDRTYRLLAAAQEPAPAPLDGVVHMTRIQGA